MIQLTCRNCGTPINPDDDAACSFHELADCVNKTQDDEPITVRTQLINGRWSAVVKRGERPIYLTDAYASWETAKNDADRFVALLN